MTESGAMSLHFADNCGGLVSSVIFGDSIVCMLSLADFFVVLFLCLNCNGGLIFQH